MSSAGADVADASSDDDDVPGPDGCAGRAGAAAEVTVGANLVLALALSVPPPFSVVLVGATALCPTTDLFVADIFILFTTFTPLLLLPPPAPLLLLWQQSSSAAAATEL